MGLCEAWAEFKERNAQRLRELDKLQLRDYVRNGSSPSSIGKLVERILKEDGNDKRIL